MDDNQTAIRQSPGETESKSSPQGKKPYEKPAVSYRGPLEALAALCGRYPPGPGKGTTTIGCTRTRS